MDLFTATSVGVGAWEHYLDLAKWIPNWDSIKQVKQNDF